jgi:phosphoribosyl 1,2-cyclic phosphate phosphodiesterase
VKDKAEDKAKGQAEDKAEDQAKDPSLDLLDHVVFLGTGDSMGVPRVYCDCPVCSEARDTQENRRFRSSLMFNTSRGQLLIDCGPDWLSQMERLQQREIRHVLITHAHFDHVGGLPEWADACRWNDIKGNVYAPAEVLQTIRTQFPWLDKQLIYHEIEQEFDFLGWLIKPFKVCHGKNGFSYAYKFSKQQYNWVYCPDSIHLNDEEKAPLFSLDLLILGTSFYKEDADPKTRSVYDMVEALQLIDITQPKQAVFTHMSHGVDIQHPYELPAIVRLAMTDMKIRLQTD